MFGLSSLFSPLKLKNGPGSKGLSRRRRRYTELCKKRLVYFGRKDRRKFRSNKNSTSTTARYTFRILGSFAGLPVFRRLEQSKRENRKVLLTRLLLPHQKEVVATVEAHREEKMVYVLHMNFGTGKTLTALYSSICLNQTQEVVYLAPAQLVPHIRNEVEKFSLSDVAKVCVCSTLVDEVRDKHRKVLIVDEYHLWPKRRKQLRPSFRTGWSTVFLMSGSPSSRDEHKGFIDSFSSGGKGVLYLDFMHVAGKILQQPVTEVRQMGMDAQQSRTYRTMVEKAGTYHQLQKDRVILSTWKIPILVRTLQREMGGKSCVVFSDFSSVLMGLWHTLISCHDTELYRVFLGSPVHRQKQVEEFRRRSSDNTSRTMTHVALCSSGVASHGLNLGEADVLVFMETPYTRRTMLQTLGRLTRIGQKHNQKVIFLIFRDSFESHLLRANCQQFASIVEEKQPK